MNDAVSSQFGPYQLLYPLGAGGMGQVFLARQRGEHGIQRLVAVKRMLAHLTGRPKLVNLFLDEVRIAAQLNHGNIVQVIDHGVVDGQYYMAMEYVHGENLLEVIARLGGRREPLPLDLALQVGSCICQGLSYAHAKQSIDGRPLGIVHRDISPQNIMISFQGEVKIADFGVARAAEQTHQTVGGELKGKLAYMSPEQAYGKPLDHRSDLFSLGVVLYEALSGRSPFVRDNPMATLEAVRAAQVVSLSTLRADLPHEVGQLVHQTLSQDADQRPDSARAMYEELQRIMRLHNMVVSAYDLADYMAELFPESQPRDGQTAPGGTAVGRRADEQGQELERRTLFYLQQRHPDLQPLAPDLVGANHGVGGDWPGETAAAARRVRRPWGPLVLAAVLVLMLTGGGLYLLMDGSTADPVASTADVDRPTSPVSDLAALATAPDHGAPAARADAAGRTAPARPAVITVTSRPAGAWVEVGGRRIPGRTPLSARLSPGRHACSVGLEGHRGAHRDLDLHPGQRVALDFALEPLPARLAVTSTHPCRVRINGQAAGEAPLRGRPVPPGVVTVTCIDAAAGVREQRRVRVGPGAAAAVSFRFGVLSINLEPWANVVVDGKPRGTTPLRLVLPEGEHGITLFNRQRGLERKRSVEVRVSRTTRISSW